MQEQEVEKKIRDDELDDVSKEQALTIVKEILHSVFSDHSIKNKLLVAFWNVSITILLDCYELEDILKLMQDRYLSIKGDGTNASSEIKKIKREGMSVYLKELTFASKVITDRLEEAFKIMEDNNIAEYFPETVFDYVLYVLVKTWGPFHVRRAISEQSALFINNKKDVLNFMEPIQFNEIINNKKAKKEILHKIKLENLEKFENEKKVNNIDIIKEEKSVKTVKEKKCEVCIRIMASESGITAWSFTSEITEQVLNIYNKDIEERYSNLEVGGSLYDPRTRITYLNAIYECLNNICKNTEKLIAKIDISSDDIMRGINNTPGSRLLDEEYLWNNIDLYTNKENYDISFKVTNSLVDRELAEKCDRMLRRILSV